MAFVHSVLYPLRSCIVHIDIRVKSEISWQPLIIIEFYS